MIEFGSWAVCCGNSVIVCHEGHDVVEIKGGVSGPCDCGGKILLFRDRQHQ
jgi:hypothetical protein